jgi:PAS domain S-box-containing protein
MKQGNLIHGPHAFGVILDCVADGVFTVNRQWVVTFFNKAAERITGVARADALGRHCFEVLRADMCAEDCALRQTMMTGQRVVGRQVTIHRADGHRLPISVSTAVLREGDGTVVGGVETIRDLSQIEDLRRKLLRRYTVSNIIARSAKMRELLATLPLFAQSDATCLIQGESGTGKEIFARAIHKASKRARGPFVAVNCGALPDTLLETELFGHEAGAFTDAKKARLGRFATAKGGTLFLDEIGDVSAPLQVRLLRVLQEKEYQPLGSDRTHKTDVRVIAATNKPLEELVDEGLFRSDLYYRINIASFVLPPLRQRPEDVPLLVEHFIARHAPRAGKEISGLSQEVLTAFMSHSWPGNVRELENAVEYATILCPGGQITAHHVPQYLCPETHLLPQPEQGTLAEWEGRVIVEAFRRHRGHRGATAKELGISKTTLWRKLKKLGLTKD